jgi:hypothetical protein
MKENFFSVLCIALCILLLASCAPASGDGETESASGEIKEENKPIAEAILKALANGQMLAVDLAVAIGQSVPKTNGVGGEMTKLGMLVKSKVKVKGKGDMTAYALPTEDTAPTEGADAEVAEDTATE